MIRGKVYFADRWVTNVFMRSSYLAVRSGDAREVSSRERDLFLESLSAPGPVGEVYE